jgi:hypothetical protein
VLCFEVSRPVFTVKREFRPRFKEEAAHKNFVFF